MVLVELLQLDLNRVLLLAVGLWLYEQSKFVRVQLILFYIILVTCIIFQFTAFATTKCNSQFVIEVLSVAFFFITLMIKYNTFSFNMDAYCSLYDRLFKLHQDKRHRKSLKRQVKHLLDILQSTYSELRDDGEVAIFRKYGTIAKRYTYILTLLSVIGVSALMFLSFWPRILGLTVLSVNETRSRVSLYIVTEYFVNQEEYFYLILLHVNTALCIGWVALLAVGTMTITYWQYACGMFKVASYRAEQAMTNKALKISNMSNDSLIHRRIICAIDMHRKALKFVKYFLSKIEVSYFFLMSAIVIALSLNLYRVFDGLSSGINVEKLISPILFLITDYVLMFLANYTAQQVKDHSNLLFTTAYNVNWYITPLDIQKTILFLLQKGTKPFNMNLVGLVVGSLEGFTTLTSTSISYFAVICSMKQ